MAMRPFEVVLLEVVPHGESPSLPRDFTSLPVPVRFAERSCRLEVAVAETGGEPAVWTVRGDIPASAAGGLLAVVLELAENDGAPLHLLGLGSLFAADAEVDGKAATVQPAQNAPMYGASWQAWRLDVEPDSPPRPFALRIIDTCPTTAERRFSAYFLPREKTNEGK